MRRGTSSYSAQYTDGMFGSHLRGVLGSVYLASKRANIEEISAMTEAARREVLMKWGGDAAILKAMSARPEQVGQSDSGGIDDE